MNFTYIVFYNIALIINWNYNRYMHLNNIINKNYLIVSIFLGLILHLISAYFTIGFYSDDEHFQILEIAGYLLGINEIAIEDTTGHYWEWREHIRMRPWFQPYIFYQFISLLKFIGIYFV